MNIQHYCYTRGGVLDYGNFSYPHNLPKKELDSIRRNLMSVIGDEVEKQLSIPKWILLKTADYIVWGVCCTNQTIASCRYLDPKNRPVRGFFAVVITDYLDSEICLPYDLQYFRKLYEIEVEPFWDQWEYHQNGTNGYIVGDFKYVRPSINEYSDILNENEFICKSLGSLDKFGVLAAALKLDNVSLLIDCDNIFQATNKNGPFMNCLSNYVKTGLYPVMRLCPRCKKYVSAFSLGGICNRCYAKEDTDVRKQNFEDEEMDKQIRKELDEANFRIQNLQFELEDAHRIIRRKDILVKILLVIIVCLSLAFTSKCLYVFIREHINVQGNASAITGLLVTKAELDKRNTFNTNRLGCLHVLSIR